MRQRMLALSEIFCSVEKSNEIMTLMCSKECKEIPDSLFSQAFKDVLNKQGEIFISESVYFYAW